MTRTNHIVRLVIVGLIITNIVLLTKPYLQKLFRTDKGDVFSEPRAYYHLNDNWLLNIETCGHKLDSINLCSDDIGGGILTKNTYSNVLVFRYHDNDCEPCVSFAMLKIKKISTIIGADKVIIFAKTSHRRMLNIAKSTYDIENKFVNIQSIPIDVDKHNVPYFFVIDDKYNIRHLFVPEKSIPYTTDQYLDGIRKRYYSDL